MRQIVFLFLMLFLCSFVVNAEYEYISDNYFYESELGLFSQNFDFSLRGSQYQKSGSFNQGMPLVSDLDNDGKNEIIVITSTSINLYHNVTLDLIDSINYVGATRIAMPVIVDLDDNGLKEIVLVNLGSNTETRYAQFYEYNGLAIYQKANVSLGARSGSGDAQGVVQCGNEQCLFITPKYALKDPAFIQNYIQGYQFNLTGTSGAKDLYKIDSSLPCLSRIPILTYGDTNNDGTNDFVIGYSILTAGADFYNLIRIDEAIQPTINDQNLINIGNIFPVTNYDSCYDPVSTTTGAYVIDMFTSPLVYNYDGALSNGLEVVYGIIYSDQVTYNLNVYSSSFNSIAKYPNKPGLLFGTTQLYGDGYILSNPFISDVFDNSGTNDFCIQALNPSGAVYNISVTCASLQTTASETNKEFVGVTAPYDVSFQNEYITHTMSYPSAFNLAFAGTTIYGSSAFISSLGIQIPSDFEDSVDTDRNVLAFGSVGIFRDVPVIINDYQQNLNPDIIGLTQNNVYYFDDNFINSPAQITQYTINPCIESVIKVNESVNVRITVEDVNDDLVSSRIIAYDGLANEQDSNWTGYSASGTTFSLFFEANQTGQNIPLSILGRDVENPDDGEEIQLLFSVATNGVEFGDCITDYSNPLVEDTRDEEVSEGEIDLDNNAVINAFNDPFIQNLGLGNTVLWVIVMFVAGLTILAYSVNATVSILGLAILETLLLILGIYLGFLGVGIIITVAVIFITILGFWLATKFTGSSSG
jgi:hypothetical protein